MYCSLKAGRIEVSNTHCCGTAVILNKKNRLTYHIVQGMKSGIRKYHIVQGMKSGIRKNPQRVPWKLRNSTRRRKQSSTEEAPRVRSPYP